jgi:peroxiredoxin Q/BCP
MPRLSPGDFAPDFSLPDHNGHTVSATSLRGQRYVLYFYPEDDTPGCTREACQFNEQRTGFDDLGVAIYGVSPDGAASHQAFRAAYGLTFTLLSDPAKGVMAAYGAYGEKLNYGKTIMGVIRSTFVISPEGVIEHAWYGIKTEGHAARVRKALS